MTQDNFLKIFFRESKAYADISNMGDLLKSGSEFLPVQPIYEYVQRLSSDQVAELIPFIPPEIKQVILDLDLWQKDEIDPESFGFWVESFSLCKDLASQEEFVQNSQFCLYLKSVFNIHTFDVEDPGYPEHDNYFLTDDNQLLFEFSEDFNYVDEVKSLIQVLYSLMGVENAYAYLFKILVDSSLIFQESEYEEKVERLRDYGFVDYYEALMLRGHHPSIKHVQEFIKNKIGATGSIDWVGKSQVLNQKSVIAFKDGMDVFFEDLDKIKDEKRTDYLRFNFTRLVNAGLALNGEDGATALVGQKVGDDVKYYLQLGVDYINKVAADQYNDSIFLKFDFFEVYKIGFSLVTFLQKKLKVSFSKYPGMQEKSFWGEVLERILNSPFDNKAKYYSFESMEEVKGVDNYEIWDAHVSFANCMLPFCFQFFTTLKELSETSKIMDHNYMNYSIEEIDFEVLLVSSMINFSLGNFEKKNANRIAVTQDELLEFWKLNFSIESGKTKLLKDKIATKVGEYTESFGFGEINFFPKYLTKVLEDHLDGYDLNELEGNRVGFKHVGGPIIFYPEQ